MPPEEDCMAVRNFRNYLKIETAQPEPDYEKAAEFIINLGKEIGLETKKVEPVPGKPFVILTLHGKNMELPSLMLYSHMDVVPVFTDHWIHNPFGGHKDQNGDIYGRGAQDMKSIGIQYLEALRQLNTNFLRTVHVVFGPDEEIGGKDGMEEFVKHATFESLNIGFVLDEGTTSDNDTYRILYAERCIWWLKVTCVGRPGHGSKLIENTAAEKFCDIVNKFQEFRESQRKLLQNNSELNLGDVISVNLTKIEGGLQLNVIPNHLTACFDIRIPPTTDYHKLLAMFEKWFHDVGPGVKHKFLVFSKPDPITEVSDSNPWWKAFYGVLDEMNLKYKTEIAPGGSDSRFIRRVGIPALGFSPIVNTPILLHDHNEKINENVFLDGLKIYCELIPALANLK